MSNCKYLIMFNDLPLILIDLIFKESPKHYYRISKNLERISNIIGIFTVYWQSILILLSPVSVVTFPVFLHFSSPDLELYSTIPNYASVWRKYENIYCVAGSLSVVYKIVNLRKASIWMGQRRIWLSKDKQVLRCVYKNEGKF